MFTIIPYTDVSYSIIVLLILNTKLKLNCSDITNYTTILTYLSVLSKGVTSVCNSKVAILNHVKSVLKQKGNPSNFLYSILSTLPEADNLIYVPRINLL